MVVALFALLVVLAPAALAYPEPPPNPPIEPGSGVVVRGVSVTDPHTSASSGLALTGGDVVGFVVIGGVLVALGTLTIVASRRRGHSTLS